MFVEWMFETSIGILDEYLTEKGLQNNWRTFRGMYQRMTNNVIHEDIGKDVLYISQPLKC